MHTHKVVLQKGDASAISNILPQVPELFQVVSLARLGGVERLPAEFGTCA